MKNSFLIIILLTMFLSCSQTQKKENITLPKKEVVEKSEIDSNWIRDSIAIAEEIKLKKNLITNDNVNEKLSQFGEENKETRIKIKTKYGTIKIKLYRDTPLHRANFLMLIKKGYFDSTLFYRVIENFMIQGGNAETDDIGVRMKNIGYYEIPNEIRPNHIHKRGALAMAVRDQSDTPERYRHRNSSAYNFYIIQKGPLSDKYMYKIEKRYSITIPEKNKKVYRTIGGSPHLDNLYTVFGEVYSGLKVIDKIASVLVDESKRPKKDIYITTEILK